MENAAYVTVGFYLTYMLAGVTAVVGLATVIEAVVDSPQSKPGTTKIPSQPVTRRGHRSSPPAEGKEARAHRKRAA